MEFHVQLIQDFQIKNILLLETVGVLGGEKVAMLESLLLKIDISKGCAIYMEIIMLLQLETSKSLINYLHI